MGTAPPRALAAGEQCPFRTGASGFQPGNKKRGGQGGYIPPCARQKKDMRYMQFKIFAIPAGGSPELEEEMNRFLRSHRVVSVQKKLESNEGSLLWCFCAEYIDGSPNLSSGKTFGQSKRIDYKSVLSAAAVPKENKTVSTAL